MNRNESNDDAIREGEPPYRGETDFGEPMRPRLGPCWNVISVLTPFAGLVLAIPFGLFMVSLRNLHPAGMGKPSASFFAGSVALGLLCGCIALARAERFWGITIFGLALNAAILALLAYWDPWSGPF